MADEQDHSQLRAILLDGSDPVITSELARVEFASAVHAAARAARLQDPQTVLARFDADCGEDGPVTLLALDPTTIFPVGLRLLAEHELHTLDALHLAVAIEDAALLAGDDTFELVTRDERQAAAARSLGLTVR